MPLNTFSFTRSLAGKPQLILHVGRHKSGTSSLQNRFDGNADFLRERGILYPAAFRGGSPQHRHLIPLLRGNPSRAELDAAREELTAEAKDFERVIISCEGLQDVQDADSLHRLFGGFDITVIAYVREAVEYAASAYAQAIQNQNITVGFDYFAHAFNINLQRFGTFWKKETNRAEFVLYERSALANGDVVTDFCQRLDIELPPEVDKDFNPTISGNLLYFKLLANMSGDSKRENYYRALSNMAAAHSHFRGKFYISPETQKSLRAKAYNRQLVRLIGKEPTQKDFSVHPPVFQPERWREDLDLIAADATLAPAVEGVRAFARQIAGI